MSTSLTIEDLQKRVEALEIENQRLRQRIFEAFLIDASYLMEVDRALHDYRAQSADDNYLTSAVSDFMTAFTSHFDIEKISEFGKVVNYDPTQHRIEPRSRLKPGDEAVVVLPGWYQKHTEKVILPLVKPQVK